MRKVILMPDSFKGTMSSEEICNIMKKTVQDHFPQCEVVSVPVADGGEGTVDSFLTALGGERIPVRAQGPYGEDMDGFYGILPDGTAVIEMAATAGLPLVGDNKHAEKTTTYGVGQLVRDAARRGCKKVVLGVGGSATNDLGCGAAAAVGVKFYGKDGNAFVPVGETLDEITKIDVSNARKVLEGVEVIAMCDIDNPLYGPAGAAYVFAPQKGADAAMVELLDQKLRAAAHVVEKELGTNISALPGSGAAGGLGGGAVAFLGAKLQMGIEVVLDVVRFDELVQGADFVFTGEGRIDTQSLRGKVVAGVGRRAQKHNVPAVAIVGDIGEDIGKIYEMGVSGVFSINRVALPYQEMKPRAKRDMHLTMDNLMRFLKQMGC